MTQAEGVARRVQAEKVRVQEEKARRARLEQQHHREWMTKFLTDIAACERGEMKVPNDEGTLRELDQWQVNKDLQTPPY